MSLILLKALLVSALFCIEVLTVVVFSQKVLKINICAQEEDGKKFSGSLLYYVTMFFAAFVMVAEVIVSSFFYMITQSNRSLGKNQMEGRCGYSEKYLICGDPVEL